jgi:hypothetical protein
VFLKQNFLLVSGPSESVHVRVCTVWLSVIGDHMPAVFVMIKFSCPHFV